MPLYNPSSGGGAPTTATYITQTADATLSAEQALSSLTTGIVKVTTVTGALSTAVNADLPSMSATVGGAVPTPPNNTTTFLRGDGTFAAPTAQPDIPLSKLSPTTDQTITAGYSAVLSNRYTIAVSTRTTIGSLGRLKVA